MNHDEFVRLYRAGRVGIFMDDGVARNLVENQPAMPKRYHSAHLFWTWVWMFTGLISCGLIPLLFGIRAAINKSARESVAKFAIESAAVYEETVAKQWFDVRACGC